MRLLASAAFAVAAMFALAASAQPPGGPPAKPKPQCFWASRVENFAAVDTQNLYLRVGIKDVYQAKLFATCLDLDWVHNLALISSPSSLICEGPTLNVDVAVRGVATGRQRCPVTNVRKLTPDEVAALPKGARP
jgi:Family of unknown function (DUF6491)